MAQTTAPRGGGYDEPIPEPVQPEPIPEEYIMADQSEPWDESHAGEQQNMKRFA